MLLIAQPKSASSSLAKAFSDILGYPIENLFGLRPRAEGFSSLPHSNMSSYSQEDFVKMGTDRVIYSIHLPPTQSNIINLKASGIKAIISLRNPHASVNAYMRHHTLGNKLKAKRITGKTRDVYLDEMTRFHDKWMKAVQDMAWGYRLCPFHFSQIIEQPATAIRTALLHLNIDKKLPEDFELPKLRYSRKID